MLLIYNEARDSLVIGPYLDNQDGGASVMSDKGVYNFIKLRVMSDVRFAVFYSNIALQGATALSMGEVTPASDLIAVGPEYVLSTPMVDSVSLSVAVICRILSTIGLENAPCSITDSFLSSHSLPKTCPKFIVRCT